MPHPRTHTLRNVSNQLKRVVAYRYEYKCANCRILLPPTWECDHIVPLWKVASQPDLVPGNPNHISNLQPLCPSCHRTKTLLESFEQINSSTAPTLDDLLKPPAKKPSYYHCPKCDVRYSPYFTHDCEIPDFHARFAFNPDA